jgi:hypothetical protein
MYVAAADAVNDKLPNSLRVLRDFASSGTGVLGAERTMTDASEYAKFEAWTRVSLPDYEQNLQTMIELAESRGMGVVLLFNEILQGSPYKAAVQKVARLKGVPLVDSSAIIAEARRAIEGRLEWDLNLHTSGPEVGKTVRLVAGKARTHETAQKGQDVEVIFRAYAGKHPVPKAFFIAGLSPQLGAAVPNVVQMYDDGTYGDERPNDRV